MMSGLTSLVTAIIVVAFAFACSWRWGLGVPSISCQELGQMVKPCTPYVTDQSAVPAPECCKGVTDMIKMGVSREDRQAICECVKAAISVIPHLDLGRAQGLPNKCGAKTDIPIGPNVNCSQVQAN